MAEENGDVTVLLNALRGGQHDAESRLLSLVYAELKRLARTYLRRERPDHTLQPTDLVHEAYLRLCGGSAQLQNRTHFFAVAARAMRRILVDHARAHDAQKRGDGGIKVPLDEALAVSAAESEYLIDLDNALDKLAAFDPRQARIVELRFFAGLSIDETADALGCAARTVTRDWRVAQAWLRRELSAHPPDQPLKPGA
jgi:RNA polymerase sigma factor (TIGR02999 family)